MRCAFSAQLVFMLFVLATVRRAWGAAPRTVALAL